MRTVHLPREMGSSSGLLFLILLDSTKVEMGYTTIASSVLGLPGTEPNKPAIN